MKRYGCRLMTGVGGIVAAAGCCLGSLATDLWHLQLAIGIVNGTFSPLILMF